MNGENRLNALMAMNQIPGGVDVTLARISAAVAVKVDRRHKAHVEPEMSETDAALESWASWAKSALAGLGWPQMTILARVMEFGVMGASQRYGGSEPTAFIEYDELCATVESAVMRLKLIERNVIVKHYLYWQPIEVSARYLHMSPGRFRTILHRSRRSVKDFLDGRKIALQQSTP